jgi:DNA-binding response OmpR family regulator
MTVANVDWPARHDLRRCGLVLLIEDNIPQLDRYALALKKEYDVLTTTRGENGYLLACGKRPDAIVLEVLLPDIDGLQLCRRLLATPDTSSIPLIVVTGDDFAFARTLTIPALKAVRRKPCHADELFRIVRHAVSGRQKTMRTGTNCTANAW